LEDFAKNAQFPGIALQGGAGLCLHPSSSSPGPVSLRDVKEQARERRTHGTLPRFSGTAT
jgi:hypothetical protein